MAQIRIQRPPISKDQNIIFRWFVSLYNHLVAEQFNTGDAKLIYATTAPEGWVRADGTTGLNSSTDTSLAELFALWGTTYGGTGAADFDAPDLDTNVGTQSGYIWVVRK